MVWRDNAKVVIVFCFVLNENENISRMLWENDSSKHSNHISAQTEQWSLSSIKRNQEKSLSRNENEKWNEDEEKERNRDPHQKSFRSSNQTIFDERNSRKRWFDFCSARCSKQKIDKNLWSPLRPINIKRVKYLIKLREIILFLLVEAVCCYFVVDLFSFFFCVSLLFFRFIQKPITCVEAANGMVLVSVAFFFSHSSALVSYWVELCTSLDYEIHTLRIGSKRNNRTWKHIFQIPDQRGPCLYLYLNVCACLALHSLFLFISIH